MNKRFFDKYSVLFLSSLIILIFGFIEPCYGQSFHVRRYTTADSLPGTEVYGITQDLQGRMWFASMPGISCFDGVNWTHYTAVEGLPSRRFIQLESDRKARIWALPFTSLTGAIVACFEDNRWHTFSQETIRESHPLHFTSLALMVQKQETIPVIGTRGKGIYLLHRKKWYHFTTMDGLADNSVTEIVALNGKFYVATKAGLSVLYLMSSGK